jgi:anti-sigma factor RsiW
MAKDDITYEMLIAYAAGELPADAVARVEAHLARFPDDAVALERIQATIQAMRADDSVDPPAKTLARAKAIFQPMERPARPSWLDRLERVVADLVFDSRTQPALAGVRGAGEAIQLAYASAVAEIDLELLPGAGEDPHQWTLMGQISVPTPASNMEVALVSQTEGELYAQTQPDAHGVFKLQLGPGVYDVVIRIERRTVVLPAINLN